MRGRPYTPFDECYKVDKTGCWIWQRAMMRNGYGQKLYRGKFDGAHRVSWLIHRGEIPRGIFVLHRCDVKKCVNPDHLFIGTQKDNILDMTMKGRTTSPLTADDVLFIKTLRDNGETLQFIGDVFGVVKQCINNIIKLRTWRHVE